jgi:hypothetical protein
MPWKQHLFVLFVLVLFLNACKDETNPIVPPSEHFDPHGWIFTDDSLNTVLVVWEGVIVNDWKGNQSNDSLYATVNSLSEHLNINFINEDSSVIDPPDDVDHTFGFIVQNTSIAVILPDEAGGWGFHIEGKAVGNTAVEFQVLHEGHVDIRTPFIPIVIRN